MQQMLSALDYLPNENLIHRALKPDNILYPSLGNDGYVFQLQSVVYPFVTLWCKENTVRIKGGLGSAVTPEIYP